MVADLLQNESVTTIVQKRKVEKVGEDSGLESGHTSMNTASDTQSEVNSGSGSGAEDGGGTRRTPDIVRTSQHSSASQPSSRHNSDFGKKNYLCR